MLPQDSNNSISQNEDLEFSNANFEYENEDGTYIIQETEYTNINGDPDYEAMLAESEYSTKETTFKYTSSRKSSESQGKYFFLSHL